MKWAFVALDVATSVPRYTFSSRYIPPQPTICVVFHSPVLLLFSPQVEQLFARFLPRRFAHEPRGFSPRFNRPLGRGLVGLLSRRRDPSSDQSPDPSPGSLVGLPRPNNFSREMPATAAQRGFRRRAREKILCVHTEVRADVRTAQTRTRLAASPGNFPSPQLLPKTKNETHLLTPRTPRRHALL